MENVYLKYRNAEYLISDSACYTGWVKICSLIDLSFSIFPTTFQAQVECSGRLAVVLLSSEFKLAAFEPNKKVCSRE